MTTCCLDFACRLYLFILNLLWDRLGYISTAKGIPNVDILQKHFVLSGRHVLIKRKQEQPLLLSSLSHVSKFGKQIYSRRINYFQRSLIKEYRVLTFISFILIDFSIKSPTFLKIQLSKRLNWNLRKHITKFSQSESALEHQLSPALCL